MKFQEKFKAFNLIDILSEKLNLAIDDETLSTSYKNIVTEVLQIVESFKTYSVSVMKKHNVHIFRKNSEIDVPFNNNDVQKEIWIKNNKGYITTVKNEDEGNWRMLKPDSNVNSNVFSRCFQKPTTNNSKEVQSSWYNSKK